MNSQAKFNELKKKQFLSSKEELYKTIFKNGYIGMELMENFRCPNFNTVISFLEKSNLDNKYRIMPSLIIEDNNKSQLEKVFKNELLNFFGNNQVCLLFSYIYNFDFEISGYVTISNEVLSENLLKLNAYNGFIINNNCTDFFYFNYSSNSKFIYIYKGHILNEKFIKII